MSKIPESIRKELAALAAKPESEIDFSDIPATSEQDWLGAERGKFYRPVKKQLTIRINADVLAWLKSQGAGYQGRMNDIFAGGHAGDIAPALVPRLSEFARFEDEGFVRVARREEAA